MIAASFFSIDAYELPREVTRKFRPHTAAPTTLHQMLSYEQHFFARDARFAPIPTLSTCPK